MRYTNIKYLYKILFNYNKEKQLMEIKIISLSKILMKIIDFLLNRKWVKRGVRGEIRLDRV